MSNPFVTVAIFNSGPPAYVVRNLLVTCGMPAFVWNHHLIDMQWDLGVAIGGVRVQVYWDDEDRASEILAEVSAGKFQLTNDDRGCAVKEWQCAHCGELAPAGFSNCWACGNARTEQEVSDVVLDASDASSDSPEDVAFVNDVARRAWYAAVFGIASPMPLVFNLYSLFLLLGLASTGVRLEHPARRLMIYAWLANIVVLLVPATAFLFLIFAR